MCLPGESYFRDFPLPTIRPPRKMRPIHSLTNTFARYAAKATTHQLCVLHISLPKSDLSGNVRQRTCHAVPCQKAQLSSHCWANGEPRSSLSMVCTAECGKQLPLRDARTVRPRFDTVSYRNKGWAASGYCSRNIRPTDKASLKAAP